MIYKILSKKFKNLPGRPADYDLLLLAFVDVILLFFSNSYGFLLPTFINSIIIVFDFITISIWGFDLFIRLRKEKKEEMKYKYLLNHWYEVAGIIPFQVLRPLLLLRGVKLAIAFYKLGKSDEEISKALTREITFKFRDIIVDTIADAVFLQSLKRVEEVMVRLNYSELAREAFKKYENELADVVKKSLNSKTTIGELSKLPFMGNIANYAGEEMSKVISEIMETEVFGNIMKEITKGILKEMYERVQKLDIERITGKKED
ncbi:MAG: hypothetical protein NZ853_01000 [Leptospiraceae bacterium]|nr:hypothetical protein [Leptospiraceae bacterium]MDW7976194.1 hypothetical protein [Leptospiraceae bacterium]